jgi:adenylate kinase
MTPLSLKRAARIILIGAPGVGKGTQSERLLKRYPQLAAISSGDLLRRNVAGRTPLGTPTKEPGIRLTRQESPPTPR